MPKRTVILLAEDREDDILLVQRGFAKAGIRNPLMVVRDGEEAINYLAGAGHFSNRGHYPLPALLLLDLTLPLTDGVEVLRWTKGRPDLKHLLVVVLTASERIHDINEAYRLGAFSFLVKSFDFHDAVGLAQAISNYHLRLKTNANAQMPAQVWPRTTIFTRTDLPDWDTPEPPRVSAP